MTQLAARQAGVETEFSPVPWVCAAVGLSNGGALTPRGMVSLWELLMTLGPYAHDFAESMRWIAEHTAIMDRASDCWDPGKLHEGLKGFLAKLRRAANGLGMTSIIMHLDRIDIAMAMTMGMPPGPNRCDLVKRQLNDLMYRVEDELEAHKFLYMPPHKAANYMNPALFGEAVNAAFPKAGADIEEAGTCFALGRNTACVFHLMRVMETGLRAIGKAIKKPLNPDAPWGAILKDLKDEIDALPNKSAAQKRKREKLSAAHARLDSVRLAWRNNVMHPKESYTEEEAQELLFNVRAFMRHLADEIV